MESTIIQTSNQKDKVLEQQKEGGNQGRRPSIFYQPPQEWKKNKEELEVTVSPKLQDPKNSKGCHRNCLQYGQNLDGIQGQRGERNETTPFTKEITLLPDSVNNLT
ncbi:hypothetical protein O181_055502 [Austropuccinia psidii MF-1]|uniref:Uncharacterized protein n=1 Tax=Austropuccinia psidii MF-1 TaxID=1389203 RepID=A0A9Q3HTI7_9BASI|nr:hypothetical protein [Austropuccinia psidii MF-1]